MTAFLHPRSAVVISHEVDHVQVVRSVRQIDMLEGPFARWKCRRECILGSWQVLTERSQEGDVILALASI
jgi:hypothetical protein